MILCNALIYYFSHIIRISPSIYTQISLVFTAFAAASMRENMIACVLLQEGLCLYYLFGCFFLLDIS